MTPVLESPNRPVRGGGTADGDRPVHTFAAWFRRHRTWTLLILVFSVGVGLTIMAQLSPRGDSFPLSTRNAAPDGARAAAEVLRSRGVDVRQTDNFGATMSALEDAAGAGAFEDSTGTTLFLYDRNGYLDPVQLQALREATDRLVVVTPRLSTLSALDGEIRPAGVVPSGVATLEPGCGLDDPAAAGAITAESAYLYKAARACYEPTEGLGGLYASSDDGSLVVLGSTQILSNRLLDEHGNAALTLRTLGASDNLVWYLPGLADVAEEDTPKTLDQLAAPWVAFIGPWLALVAVLAMAWRGRRLGPLVFEPLPVVVKAVETAEGRARLYHDAHAVDRAADSLRAGTLVRLARVLRLGPDAESTAIVDAAARHLGRTREETARVLEGRPRTESELVHWAQQLESLEKEVTAQ
ncbi:hypothetical protein ASF98_01505 [Arthrobacter sp. Leaf337]|uniref:DUF4350 domain-containing protein n=1 Tax=Arthrobacter sp. Leaf337 TaxID=1736342 RepID=UPI0006FF8BB2|nr:DUF4350 domain-containing protein [Arthrobacter sp. Leaf337]KQR82708.1 hypothetical protein ASF98_01505 [Arthrobacter sp. Leaf337]